MAMRPLPDHVGRRRPDLNHHPPCAVWVQPAEGPESRAQVVSHGHHPTVEQGHPLARPVWLAIPAARAADLLGELLVFLLFGHRVPPTTQAAACLASALARSTSSSKSARS